MDILVDTDNSFHDWTDNVKHETCKKPGKPKPRTPMNNGWTSRREIAVQSPAEREEAIRGYMEQVDRGLPLFSSTGKE